MSDKNQVTVRNDSCTLGASHESSAQALLSILCSAQELLNELGAEFSPEQNSIQELENRLTLTRFNLAVLGQFKRGKSTLLNALLGEELLPTAVIPLTSVPTFLSWGPKRLVRVIFLDGHIEECSSENVQELNAFLARYVTEEGNPKNLLGVSRVEVAHPSPLLQNGVVLIDTPGIGSTFQHNTEATLNFLPQCDGALFLVSADPPITQVEIEFLKAVRDRAARIFFIMNKADYLNEGERKAAIEFFQAVLREQLQLDGAVPVFPVSARQGLEAKLKGNDRLWIGSGMSGIENYLVKFLAEEKIQTLNQAIARKTGDILEDALLRLNLKQRSLTLPMEELEQRLVVFNQKLQEVEHQRLLAQDVLKGDQERLLEMLDQECTKTIQEVKSRLSPMVEETLATSGDIRSIDKTARSRLAEVIPELFEESLSRVRQLLNQRTKEVLNNHREKANALANIIRRTAVELFEIPYAPGGSSEALEIRHEPYWITENWSVTMSPIPRGLFERLLPRNMALRHIKKWLQQDTEAIVLRNVSNLQWETKQNINDTFYRFSFDLDNELKGLASATRGAIEEAQIRRIQRVDSVSEELSRLNAFEAKLQEIQKGLAR
jgi:GTP-binding protein EngB required for normal cell division